MTQSTHRAEVVPVELEPHPNADRLSIVRVWGYTVVIGSKDFEDYKKGVYFTPDTLVPNTSPFEFLFAGKSSRYSLNPDGTANKDKEGHFVRITVKRFRGILSQGLLLPTQEGEVGDDMAEVLGIKRYEPAIPISSGGEVEKGPEGVYLSKYHVEAFERYKHIFEDDEVVIVREKIHGANASYLYHDGRMWAKSHKEWKRKDSTNLWWRALKQHPEIEDFCKTHPGIIVCAEVYGSVQSLKYGMVKGQVRIAVFDLYMFATGGFLPAVKAKIISRGLPWVPTLCIMPFDEARLRKMADGPSLVPGADNIREGIVIKPYYKERRHEEAGRVQLKLVSGRYLEKGK